MEMRALAPPVEWAPFVHELREVRTEERVVRTLMPETSLLLGIRLSGTAWLHRNAQRIEMPLISLTGFNVTRG